MKKLRLLNYIACVICVTISLLIIGASYTVPVLDVPAGALAMSAALFFGVPGLFLGLSGRFLPTKPTYVLLFSIPVTVWGMVLLLTVNEVLYIVLLASLFLMLGTANIYFAVKK